MTDLAQRPAWLPPDFIALTEGSERGKGLPVYVHARAVMAVEDVGSAQGSLVRIPATPEAIEVLETPQQVFAAITKATA